MCSSALLQHERKCPKMGFPQRAIVMADQITASPPPSPGRLLKQIQSGRIVSEHAISFEQ